jgi:hypothetical protein
MKNIALSEGFGTGLLEVNCVLKGYAKKEKGMSDNEIIT